MVSSRRGGREGASWRVERDRREGGERSLRRRVRGGSRHLSPVPRELIPAGLRDYSSSLLKAAKYCVVRSPGRREMVRGRSLSKRIGRKWCVARGGEENTRKRVDTKKEVDNWRWRLKGRRRSAGRRRGGGRRGQSRWRGWGQSWLKKGGWEGTHLAEISSFVAISRHRSLTISGGVIGRRSLRRKRSIGEGRDLEDLAHLVAVSTGTSAQRLLYNYQLVLAVWVRTGPVGWSLPTARNGTHRSGCGPREARIAATSMDKCAIRS